MTDPCWVNAVYVLDDGLVVTTLYVMLKNCG